MTSKLELNALRPRSRIGNAFDEFVKNQSSSGIILLICAMAAMLWANSPYSHYYQYLLHIDIGAHFHHFVLERSLQHWANDLLMVIFFLLVGLEIKREVLTGELSSVKTATLPVAAAIGGMLIPAGIFAMVNWHHPQYIHGWAIPMATDIAFALGLLSLLSNRIPRGVLILLTALAIVDDIGAIVVIAVFYTKTLHMYFIYGAAGVFALMIVLNRLRVFKPGPYLILGVILWLLLLNSGLHATIAGILIAMVIPARSVYKREVLSHKMSNLVSKFDATQQEGHYAEETRKFALQEMEHVVHGVEAPLQRLEHRLHLPVNFIIIPIFVFLNAGVTVSGISFSDIFTSPLALGIILGLVVGKLIGIFGTCFITSKIDAKTLPRDVNYRNLTSLSLIAGIGFTMSIFIAELAFPHNAQLLNLAKLGILMGSLISAVLGVLMTLLTSKKQPSTIR